MPSRGTPGKYPASPWSVASLSWAPRMTAIFSSSVMRATSASTAGSRPVSGAGGCVGAIDCAAAGLVETGNTNTVETRRSRRARRYPAARMLVDTIAILLFHQARSPRRGTGGNSGWNFRLRKCGLRRKRMIVQGKAGIRTLHRLQQSTRRHLAAVPRSKGIVETHAIGSRCLQAKAVGCEQRACDRAGENSLVLEVANIALQAPLLAAVGKGQ